VQPGNWVAFADQDDIWVSEKLEKLKEALGPIDDESTPALVYSDLAVIDKDDRIVYPSFWDEQQIRAGKIRPATLLYGNVVTGCTMLTNYAMAKEFIATGANTHLHDEWLGLIAYTFGRAKLLNEKLVLYRQHENNITFSSNYKRPGFFGALSEGFQYLTGQKKFLSRQFALVRDFYSKYKSKLTNEQRQIFENFIKLEKRNYIIQRITRRITYQ
jgi:hypothetical protein